MQTVVVTEKVVFATTNRCAEAFEVPQFGQPLNETLALRDRIEESPGHFVLRCNPLRGRFAFVLFQPTIRIGNDRAVIVIDNVAASRLGISGGRT